MSLIKDECENCGCEIKRPEKVSARVLALTCTHCEETQTFHAPAGEGAIKTTPLDLTASVRIQEAAGGGSETHED